MPNIFEQIAQEEEQKPASVFEKIAQEDIAKPINIFHQLAQEDFATRPEEDSFLIGYYKWLHTETEPPKSVYDFLTRVIPKSASSTAVGLAEFPYYAVKTTTDPMYEFAKDLIIRDKPIWKSAKERGLQLGKGILDMAIGFGEFMGEPIGIYGWERFKNRWLTDPVGAGLAISVWAKGIKGKGKKPIGIMPKQEFGTKAPGTLRKVYEWLDIQAKFTRSEAESTGIAIKGFPTMKIVEQKHALEVAKKLRKLGLEEGEGLEVTLRAAKKAEGKPKPIATFRGWQENVPGKEPFALYNVEGGRLDKSTVGAKTLEKEGIAIPETLEKLTPKAKEAPKPPTRIDQAAAEVRTYFKDTFKRLKEDKVLKYPWPETMIIRNDAQIASLRETMRQTPLKNTARIETLRGEIKAIEALNRDLKSMDVEYVHIPLDMWFGKIYEAMGKEQAQGVIHSALSSKFFKGRFFKQRKTLDIGEMIDWLKTLEDEGGKPIFTDLDFDARMIMASYAQKVGVMRGLAKIFNAAKKDGLVIGKGEGVKTGYGEPPLEMTIKFPELKDHYIHNAFIDYLDGYMSRIDKSQQLGRIFGYTKMMAFYNPFFLPAYDLWQGTWLGSVNPLRPIKSAKYIYKGFKSTFIKDAAYWEASENIAFSTPYSPPFENFMRDMQGTMEGKFAKRVLNRLQNYTKVYPIIDDFYKAVWNMAWTGDNAIRMGSYHYLKEKGYTPRESGQMTAYFHADYARMTPQARRILNKIFFTPSFKYTMGHLQANMVKSSVNVMRNAMKLKKPEARDLMMMKGGAALIAGLIAKDQLMKLWGFKTDDLGLRYVKTTETDEGSKELVLYWPDPNNVILRQVHKWTKWGDDPDKLDAFMNKAHWDLHPVWQLAYEIIKDIKPDGKHVYNPFDDPQKIAWDQLHHSVSRIMAVEGFMEKYIGTKDAKSAYKALRKDIGGIWEKLLSTTTLSYLRQPESARKAWQIQKLKRLFNQFIYEDTPKTEGVAQTRLNNFFDRIKEIQGEMGESPKSIFQRIAEEEE